MSPSTCALVVIRLRSKTDSCRRASEDSVLAIQIFDQKKFKKKDQGFLGVINVRVGDVIQDMDIGGDGKQSFFTKPPSCTDIYRNAHSRS